MKKVPTELFPKYSVIYVDPPWSVKTGRSLPKYVKKDGKQIWGSGEKKSRDLSFPSMTVDQIKSLGVQDICNPNCHLYLWTTNGYLPAAFDVIKSWGFTYSTTIVWCKKIMGGGLGGTWKINTEYLLFATKGSLKPTGVIKGTHHSVKRDYSNGFPQHSRKPEVFRKMIESVSPGPYAELFARRKVIGWDVWGNEVKNDFEF